MSRLTPAERQKSRQENGNQNQKLTNAEMRTVSSGNTLGPAEPIGGSLATGTGPKHQPRLKQDWKR